MIASFSVSVFHICDWLSVCGFLLFLCTEMLCVISLMLSLIGSLLWLCYRKVLCFVLKPTCLRVISFASPFSPPFFESEPYRFQITSHPSRRPGRGWLQADIIMCVNHRNYTFLSSAEKLLSERNAVFLFMFSYLCYSICFGFVNPSTNGCQYIMRFILLIQTNTLHTNYTSYMRIIKWVPYHHT